MIEAGTDSSIEAWTYEGAIDFAAADVVVDGEPNRLLPRPSRARRFVHRSDAADERSVEPNDRLLVDEVGRRWVVAGAGEGNQWYDRHEMLDATHLLFAPRCL